MKTGGAQIIRTGPRAKGALGRYEHLFASAANGGAENLFGEALRIDVGGVEHRQPRFETDRDQAGGLLDARRAEGFEYTTPAESPGAETQNGDLQSRTAQLSIFHVFS